MMKQSLLAITLAVAMVVPTYVGADDFYRLYGGGEGTVCAYPTSTTSNTDWALTGEASAHLTIDDNQPLDNCVATGTSQHDSDTTYISCPISTATCSADFGLSDPDLTGKTVLRVAAWAVIRRGDESGKTAPIAGLSWVISSIEYAACTKAATSTDYETVVVTCQADLSPATSVAWTSSEINGMDLRVKITNSANQTLYVTAAGVSVAWVYDL